MLVVVLVDVAVDVVVAGVVVVVGAALVVVDVVAAEVVTDVVTTDVVDGLGPFAPPQPAAANRVAPTASRRRILSRMQAYPLKN